jgi:hypothetical protein
MFAEVPTSRWRRERITMSCSFRKMRCFSCCSVSICSHPQILPWLRIHLQPIKARSLALTVAISRTDVPSSQYRVSKHGLSQPGGTIIHWVGSRAEPKRLNPRSTGKACWHPGSGKQEEKWRSRGRIRDQRMGSAGIWAESNRTEPTGFGSSVANFLPLSCPSRGAVSKGATFAGFGGNSWGKSSSRYQASASRAKAPHICYSHFRVADRSAACGRAERTSPHPSSRVWCLARNDPSHSASCPEAAWTARCVAVQFQFQRQRRDDVLVARELVDACGSPSASRPFLHLLNT